MICFNPIVLTHLVSQELPNGLEVPCGKCLACRIARSREWTLRLFHEMESWSDAVFATLTYDSDNLPVGGSLVKADLQKFIKRLRKCIALDNKHMRYFAGGEYGDNFYRPHYHCILFGLSLDDHQLIQDVWNRGFVHIGSVTYDSIRYCTKYIFKKYYKEDLHVKYTSRGLKNQFQICSHGLGLAFALQNKDRFSEDCFTTVRGVKVGLPRYYKSKLEIDKAKLAFYSSDRALAKALHYLNLGLAQAMPDGSIQLNKDGIERHIRSHKQSVATIRGRVGVANDRPHKF